MVQATEGFFVVVFGVTTSGVKEAYDLPVPITEQMASWVVEFGHPVESYREAEVGIEEINKIIYDIEQSVLRSVSTFII
jgi:hypothetical protein